jgi:transcriptional regulator with XRE-family HTH domain
MSTVISDAEAKQNLAENVRRLLESRGMTQSQLAEAAHETQATISRIVNGLQLAGGGILIRLAEAFDVSVDRLLMTPPQENLAESRKSA